MSREGKCAFAVDRWSISKKCIEPEKSTLLHTAGSYAGDIQGTVKIFGAGADKSHLSLEGLSKPSVLVGAR